nr:hypothetical protein [Tanacetum cinerariifolium]
KQIYGAAYTKLIKKGRKIAAIDQDHAISLVQHDVEIQGRNGHDMEVNTAEPIYTASAAVTTASITVSTASPTRLSTANDITMAETLVYIRKSAAKEKEEAVRLQAEMDKEERQRISRVHETASSFNIEEWEDIQARVKADEEMRRVNTFVPIETEVRRGVPELVADSSQAAVKEAGGTKRTAEEELGHQSSKK